MVGHGTLFDFATRWIVRIVHWLWFFDLQVSSLFTASPAPPPLAKHSRTPSAAGTRTPVTSRPSSSLGAASAPAHPIGANSSSSRYALETGGLGSDGPLQNEVRSVSQSSSQLSFHSVDHSSGHVQSVPHYQQQQQQRLPFGAGLNGSNDHLPEVSESGFQDHHMKLGGATNGMYNDVRTCALACVLVALFEAWMRWCDAYVGAARELRFDHDAEDEEYPRG